ncbi:hypothetical protein GQ457_09G011870 [Hibiscus cannabinus]
MANPSGRENPSELTLIHVDGNAAGGYRGRPSDPVVIGDEPAGLERSGLPFAFEIQPCNIEDRNLVENVSDVAMGDRVATQTGADGRDHLVVADSEKGAGGYGEISRQPTPSFRDKLLGSIGGIVGKKSIAELDVDVRHEDVRLGGTTTLPEISLIDMDNEFYLVRFAEEDDYNMVLTEGPWVIYGSYLTVQPWSRSFSTSTGHPSQIIVWVRLPNLSYRYYTKSLFRHIAAAIGKVVRVDYNTAEGKRGRFARLAIVVDLEKPLVSGIIIDGHRQDIEYEGLLEICFKCGKYGHAKDICGISLTIETTVAAETTLRSSDDLFGPWMQALSRRRRNVPAKKDVGSTVAGRASRSGGSGSRYSVIADVQGSDAADEDVVPVHHNNRDTSISANIVVPLVVPARAPSTNHGVRICGRVVIREREDSPLREEQPKGVTNERVESGQLEQGLPVPLASQGRVVAAKTSLPTATNVAVHVMDSGLPSSSRVMKGMRKKEGRMASHSTLEAGLSNLMEDLAQSELLEVSRLGSSPPQGVGDGDQVVWEHNSAFEQMPSSDMQF